jgi:hypothetical protein
VHSWILRALASRRRYRYVRPRVAPEGGGWKIVSPNCSRNIDPAGGEIAVAWLLPANQGAWLLHSRNHADQCWRIEFAGLSLDEALTRLCQDPRRIFWP